MPQCAGIKREGGRCAVVVGGQFCYHHDPDQAQKRKRVATRGGKSKPNREIAAIKGLLSDLTDRVLGAEGADPLQTGPASVANQLINTRLRAVELERKVREVDELEARLEELESLLARQKERGGYVH
jgi:hypothetical protein